MNYHKLLARQVRRCWPDPSLMPPSCEALLALVDQAYKDFDEDRTSIERTLDLMSHELTQRNAELRHELSQKQLVQDALIAEKNEHLALIKKLEEAHNQLLQSEKLASIGQLAAGVAHEINNPIGFVSSNLTTLRNYVNSFLEATAVYDGLMVDVSDAGRQQVAAMRAKLDFDFMKEDAVSLLEESAEGIRRVRQIVQDLKDFSHVDEAQWQWADLHKGLNSTINIVNNEIKYVADVVKEYGLIPEVQCLASQLNQVFLNMLINASHAIKGERGVITIRTGQVDGQSVFVEIADNGCGMAPEVVSRIFDPFFTTKPVGKGTGLGLSLAYSIMNKHKGRIDVRSQVGEGTTFRMTLPIQQADVMP